MSNLEDEYFWEIKKYLEQPNKETLLELLEFIYEEGFEDGWKKADPAWMDQLQTS